jgi:hypothetical protein
MAICNRDMDASEQKECFERKTNLSVGASAGTNFWITGPMPFPGTVKAVQVAHFGLSGAPVGSIEVIRFIPGTGQTQIIGLGATLTASAIGTSGVQGFSLVAAGSTLLNLQAGDILVYNQLFSGGNVATAQSAVTAIIQKTQDIVSMFGSQS